MSRLTVTPDTVRFGVGDAATLRETLIERDMRSVFCPARYEEDVLLDSEGRTIAGGHRYTEWALYQVCQVTCPGLYALITEYAGEDRSRNSIRSNHSFEEAIGIFNRVVRRRFRDKISGRQMLRDIHTGVIDGVVGAAYRWLPNRTLFEQTEETFRQYLPVPVLYDGSLDGRRMMLRFCSTKTYCELEGPGGGRDRFVRGYHISNDEVGRAAARIGSLLIRDIGKTAALLGVSAGRVQHRGNSVQARVRKLFYRLPEQLLGGPEMTRKHLLALRQSPLGFSSSEDNNVQRRLDLIHLLSKRRLTRSASLRVVSDAVFQGSYDALPTPLRQLSADVTVGRTVYDLYNAIGRFAASRSVTVRERVEQTAFALLSGQFAISTLEEGQ